MKQLVMAGPARSVLVDVPIPGIGEDEILVRMKYCGVCRSEHESWAEASPGRQLGHEPVGTVVRVGAGVEGFAPGDRVSGWAFPALMEYVAFKAVHAVKIPDAIRDEDATVEPLACVVSAVSKLPPQPEGQPVAVIGCGYMGLAAISLMKARGRGPIVAVDPRPAAREGALRMGAAESWAPDQLPACCLSTWESGCEGGFALVCEWAGSQDALDLAGRMAAVNGFLGIGGYHAGGRRQVDMQLWNYKALSAVSLHERDMIRLTACTREAFQLLEDGTWPFTGLRRKVYRLDQFDLAQQEIITKPEGLVKGLIDCTCWQQP